MKQLFRSLALPLFLFIFVACGATPIAVDQAVKDGKIKLSFSNVDGNSSGDILIVNMETTGGSDGYNVEFPAGLIIRNATADNESFVVIRYKGKDLGNGKYDDKSTPIVSSSSKVTGVLEAYSIDAFLNPPTTSDSFSLDGSVSGDLKSVVDVIAGEKNDALSANQLAIWAITDDVSRTDLDDLGYSYTEDELTLAKALITKAKLDPAKYQLFQ